MSKEEAADAVRAALPNLNKAEASRAVGFRRHLKADETEAAARAKLGDEAQRR